MRRDAAQSRVKSVPAIGLGMYRSSKSVRLMLLAILLLTLLLTRSTGAERVAPRKLYTSDEESGNVAVIDGVTGQVLQHIDVGKRPRGLKISRNQKFLYVALSG